MKKTKERMRRITEKLINGFWFGLAMEVFVSIILSLVQGDGSFHIVAPEFSALIGSEIWAVITQSAIFAVCFMIVTVSDVIWDTELRPITRLILVAGLKAVFVSFSLFFRNYNGNFAETLVAICAALLALFAVYLVIFAIPMIIGIRKMNKKLREDNKE